MKRVARPLIDRAESGDCACVWTVVSVVCVRDLDDLRVSETHGHSVRVTANFYRNSRSSYGCSTCKAPASPSARQSTELLTDHVQSDATTTSRCHSS